MRADRWLDPVAGPARTPARRSGSTPRATTPGRRSSLAGGCAVEIDLSSEPTGVLVVADGANTLTPAAPGGYQPSDVEVQDALDDALAGGDVAALAQLPAQVGGRVAFGVLAGLAEPTPRSCQGALPRGALRRRVLRRRLAAVRPLAIVGPTGTGKSQLALDVAERLGGEAEIVNADAMQFYRGMDIGTAKLPVAQRRGIPHHQLDVLDVTATATVARYQQDAVAQIEAIAARGKVPVLVGGSMLYIQSLLDDWSFPATDPAVRAKWEQRLAEVGAGALHGELAHRDAAAAASILTTDGRRIVRALEVVELTGQPFAASAPVIGTPRWGAAIIGLDCETELLDQRLAQRTETMFTEGLVEEGDRAARPRPARRCDRVAGAGLRPGSRRPRRRR